MRRSLAGAVLGLSLVIASVAWASFVLTHTVLDPTRSERLADQVLENQVLRGALVNRLSDAIDLALPPALPVPPDVIDQAADQALDDPRTESLIRDGLVRVHQNALAGIDEPVVLNADSLGEASRAALVEGRPELDAALPAAPKLELVIPTTGLSWLGRLRQLALQATWILGTASVIGMLTALVVTRDRPASLRRVSSWAFGASAFWLIVGVAIPFAAQSVAPVSMAYVAALVDVFFSSMIPPAIVLAVLGVALRLAAFGWSRSQRTRGARLLRSPRSPGRDARVGGSVGSRRSNVATVPAANAGPSSTTFRAPTDQSASSQPAANDSPWAQQPSSSAYSQPDPTQALPTTGPNEEQRADPGPAAEERPATPRWVEGVGYIDD